MDQGASALVASHRVDEILAVADCVHVLRDGCLVLSCPAAQTDPEQIRRAILAKRKPTALPPRRPVAADTVLAIEKLALPGFAGRISLQIAAGETVGIAGMAGNGQNELMEVLAGFRRPVAGTIRIGGRLFSGGNGRRLGMRCIMEDPLADACMPDMTIAENLVVHDYRRRPYSDRFALLQGRIISEHADRVIARARLAARRSSDLFCWLSGGNQRKLLVERELAGNPAVVAAHNPTAGLDSAAAAAVVASLARACERETAVLLCSEDLDVLSGCSDRLMVMANGSLLEVAGSDLRQAAVEIMWKPPKIQ